MRPLPTVGGDTGTWGTVLNTFLSEIFPAGGMIPYAGAAAPTGWLLCDGTSYLRADYNDLFTALGGASSPWGLPDGTHFNVPDLRGRLAVGKGTHANVDVLGDNDGSALDDRQPKHRHTVTDPTHHHTQFVQNTGATAATFAGGGGSNAASADTGQASTGITIDTAGATAPLDGPAFVTVNYIIKT